MLKIYFAAGKTARITKIGATTAKGST